MLVKAGYNLPSSGASAQKLLKAALRDWLQPSASHPVGDQLLHFIGADTPGSQVPSGLRNPHGFKQRYGLLRGGGLQPPSKTPGPRLTDSGTQTPADVASTYTPPGGVSSAAYTAPLVDLTGLDRLAKTLGVGPVAPKFGQIPLIDPRLASQLVSGDDANIRDLQLQIARHPRDAAQSLADIRNWMGQVAAARAKGAGQDAAISKAGISSAQDAVNSIVSSLGGSANMGSGDVAASGADTVGLLQALGANQDSYNSDLKTLLAGETAGDLARQSALNTSAGQDLQQKLMDAQSTRQADKAQALMQILSQNADRRNANNTLAQNDFTNREGLKQTNFQDQLALEQAREAAQLTGAKTYSALAKAAQPPKTPPPPKGSFGASSTADRSNFARDILSQVAPQGKLASGMTWSKALTIARRIAHVYFPHGGIPNGTGIIAGILQQAGLQPGT